MNQALTAIMRNRNIYGTGQDECNWDEVAIYMSIDFDRAAGASYQVIADRLNAEGTPAPGNCGRWTPTVVRWVEKTASGRWTPEFLFEAGVKALSNPDDSATV